MWRDGVPPGPPVNIHVTHFSDKGLIAAFKKYGGKNFKKITAGGWVGFLISF
jgi:hypothetical protein